MPTKKQPKQPKKSKKTVPNVAIAERISLNVNKERRDKMIRQAPKPAGIDTAEILNKGYLLQKAMASKIVPQTQSQSINLYLDSYGRLENQQQIRRIDDDIQAFGIKAERGVDTALTNPAIARLQQQRRELPLQQRRGLPLQQARPFVDVYDPFLEREYEFDVKKPATSAIPAQRVPSPFVAEIREEVVATRNLEGTVPVPVRRPMAGRPLRVRSEEATTFVAERPDVAREVALIYESQRKREARERTTLARMLDPEPPATAGGGLRGRPRRTNIDAGSAIAERQTEFSRAQPAQLTRGDQGQQEFIFGGGPAVPIRIRRSRSQNPEPEAQSQLRAMMSDVYSTDVDFQEPPEE
jgi:hypothetical protein